MDVIHKITIGDWNYYTKTGDISELKKYGVSKNNINELVGVVGREMNGEIDLSDDFNNLNSKFRIQELVVFYKQLHMLLVHSAKIELWMLEIKSAFPDFEYSTDPKLEGAINSASERLKTKYGIDIATIEDLTKLESEINRRIDKLRERKKEKIEGMTFFDVIEAVFRTLGMNIDYKIVLSDFFKLKDKAIEHGRTQRKADK